MDAHAKVVLQRLDAHPKMSTAISSGQTVVYDGPRTISEPVRKPPYVVFYLTVDDERPSKLNGVVTDESWFSISTHGVGENRLASDTVRGYIRAQLLDWVPVVPGWSCRRVSHVSGDLPDWDDTTGLILMDAVDHWSYRAHPQ